ncbi:MAG: DUF4129 domain-containing protein [Verrucomicrobiales bacterium]|nr:DUF4129 domain-containing protein [Verrucomicrobiales bacterium]
MNLRPVAILAPLAASLTAWMLSGSPVPMALSILVLLTSIASGAIIGKRGDKARLLTRTLAPAMIAGSALFIETRLFTTGEALALRAELTFPFHLGIGLLWWVTADVLAGLPKSRNSSFARQGLVGIFGGLVLLTAATATQRYDFGPWEIYPLAALPVVAFITRSLLPASSFFRSLILIVIPGVFAITGLVLASTSAGEKLRPWFFPNEFESDDSNAFRPAAPAGSRSLIDGASRHLPREANIHFNHHVEVQIKAHSPALFRSWLLSPVYVRTSTLALFESDEVVAPIRSGRWLYDIDDGNEDNTIRLKDVETVEVSPYTLFISRDSVGQLPVLSNSTTLFSGAVYEFADDWYQLAPAEEITRLRYSASAPPLSSAADPSFDIERLRKQDAAGIYLNLPPSPLASQVTELTAGFGSEDPLKSIRDFLRVNTTYSLNFSTPEDSSPVKDFLFGGHQGHCEHYAAATVMMLRSLGVPSRIAYGYAGGSADEGQSLIAFRDSDFHAWAEILTPEDNQWVIFDTTPNVPAAAPRLAGTASLPAMDETLYHDFSEFAPRRVNTRRDFGEMVAEVIAFLSSHFLLSTAIGLGLLAGIWWILPRRGETRKMLAGAGQHELAPPPFVPEFLRELERGARNLGLNRKPGHTWRELINRLADQQPLPDHLHAAIAYYYSVCYSGNDRDPAAEKKFLHQIRAWHGNLQPD